MAHRSFAPKRPDEPMTFDVGDDEIFACIPRLPAGYLLDMAALQSGPVSDRMKALGEFFDYVLTPESAERFQARLRDPNRPIDLEQLGDIVRGLVEDYSGRPTEADSPSSGGPLPTGTD